MRHFLCCVYSVVFALQYLQWYPCCVALTRYEYWLIFYMNMQAVCWFSFLHILVCKTSPTPFHSVSQDHSNTSPKLDLASATHYLKGLPTNARIDIGFAISQPGRNHSKGFQYLLENYKKTWLVCAFNRTTCKTVVIFYQLLSNKQFKNLFKSYPKTCKNLRTPLVC